MPFNQLMSAQKDTLRWKAERDNSATKLELAQQHERMAYLISQHQPVADLGLDRERLSIVLRYIRHGEIKRVERELAALTPSPF